MGQGRVLTKIERQGLVCGFTHTATGGHGDLDGVPARLTHLLQVQRLMGGFVVSSLNGERSRVDAHLSEEGQEEKEDRGAEVGR